MSRENGLVFALMVVVGVLCATYLHLAERLGWTDEWRTELTAIGVAVILGLSALLLDADLRIAFWKVCVAFVCVGSPIVVRRWYQRFRDGAAAQQDRIRDATP